MPVKAEQFNLTREEYLGKGSTVVVWDQIDYLKGAEKQLSDKSTYLGTKTIVKDLVSLYEQSKKKCLRTFKEKRVIQKSKKNYFKFNFKKATNLRKLTPKTTLGIT